MAPSALPSFFAACCLLAAPRATLGRTSSTTPITAREGLSTEDRVAEPDIELQKPVLQLNQYTFDQSVLATESGNGVQHWIILFCLEWFEPCEIVDRPYAALAGQWQDRMNTDLLSTEVRFAYVDCATDRVLCNEQLIEEYPMIFHYHLHELVTAGPVGRALNYGGIPGMLQAMNQYVVEELAPILNGRTAPDEREELGLLEWARAMVPGRRDLAVDAGVVVLALLGNAWLLLRGYEGGAKPDAHERCEAKEPEDVAAVGTRILPDTWARERAGVEL